jgi:hypothetical protein
MTDQEPDLDRRAAVQTLLGGLASLPLVTLAGAAAAQATTPPPPDGWESFPHVDEAADPTAIALKYRHDAAAADRAGAAKPGAPPEAQNCANCQLIQADAGEWRPCTLFPGKLVAANGWCNSWIIKAGG